MFRHMQVYLATPSFGIEDISKTLFRGLRLVRFARRQGRGNLVTNPFLQQVKVLLEHGADTELVTSGACLTALHCAAMGDAPAAIQTLIEAGGYREKQDYRGRTPLLFAVEFNR